MKFEALPEQIVPAAKRAISISDEKGSRMVHRYVLIEVMEDMVIINSLNASCFFSGRATIHSLAEEGEAVVEAKRLGSILKCLVEGEPVTFHLKGNFLHIRQATFKAKIPHFIEDEFPEFDFSLSKPVTTVLGEIEINALARTMAPVDEKDDNQPQGILFDFVDSGKMRIVGSSYQQIHVFQKPMDPSALTGYRFCISKSAAETLVGFRVDNLAMHVDRGAQSAVFEATDAKLRVRFTSDTHHPQYFHAMGLSRMDEGVYVVHEGNDPSKPTHERWFAEFDLREFIDAFASCCTVLGKFDASVRIDLTEYAKSPDGVLAGKAMLTGLNNETHAKAERELLCRVANTGNRVGLSLHKDRAIDSIKQLGTPLFRLWFHDQAHVIATEVYEEARPDYQFAVVLMAMLV